MMQKITFNLPDLGKSTISLGLGIAQNLQEKLEEDFKSSKKILILTDTKLYDLYGKYIEKALEKSKFEISFFVYENTPNAKNIDNLQAILEKLLKKAFTRQDLLLCLGGGLCSDLGGLVTGLYKRGMHLAFLPTSLLSCVDASVGGKTAIDHFGIKNCIGMFKVAEQIYIDPIFLTTLEPREFQNGMAEIIKYAISLDKSLFLDLKKGALKDNLFQTFCDLQKQIFKTEASLESFTKSLKYPDVNVSNNQVIEAFFEKLSTIIQKSITLKISVLKKDPFDQGERFVLNFGHSLGHALESASNYSLKHGEAVSIGMIFILDLAYQKGYISKDAQKESVELIKTYKLPVSTHLSFESLKKFLIQDKKQNSNGIRLVFPKGLGNYVFINYQLDDYLNACKSFIQKGNKI